MNKLQNLIWQARLQKNKNWLLVSKLLKNGISEFPQEKTLYLELGDLYYSKKIFQKALDTYHHGLRYDKNDELFLIRIGNCFLNMGEYKLAIDYYDRIEDKSPELIYNKAFALSKMKNLAAAIELLETVKKAPFSHLPLIFLAELYFAGKEYSKGLECIELAEKKFGKRKTFFYMKGLGYMNQKIWLKAYLEFNQAEKLKYKTAHFFRVFGIVCDRIGKTSEAVINLMKSIELSPYESASYIELLNLYLRHNRLIEAYSIALSTRKLFPSSYRLALIFQQLAGKLNLKD